MAVHIALYEIDAPFDVKPISFSRQENRSQEYLKINSEGKVPTLLVDGKPLTEVLAILFFLAQSFPEARLISDRTGEQAQTLSWMSFIASTLHAARRRGIEYATEVYKIADRRLADCAWVTGLILRSRHSSLSAVLALQLVLATSTKRVSEVI
jgi:glutathione S-transferase